MAFGKLCLHYMDSKLETLKPRRLGEVVYGTEVGELIHFDLFHIGTVGVLRTNGVGRKTREYFLVLVENESDYSWLELAVGCMAETLQS